jgi:hypothetical protein
LNMLYRKRTKKAQSKAGRKKSKKTTPEGETVATPRTRAAAAREAARAAEEADREATREVDQEADAVAREAAAAAREPQAEASSAKRRLDLDPVPLVVAGPSVPLEALTKKLTPRKKLATKVNKS